MPNRIIREGILTSERVNSLGWEEEIFYRRLHSVVDDFGRYTAHPALLRAALYPLKLETVREANVQRLLASVEAARLVRLYEVEGKRYLEVSDFRQQVRARDSKYPPPPDGCVADATQVPSKGVAPAHLGGVVSGVEGGGEGDARAPAGDAEIHSKQTCLSQAANASIPADFAELVYVDWFSRQGKDGGGILIPYLNLATRRWHKERAEWEAGTHRGKKAVPKKKPDRPY